MKQSIVILLDESHGIYIPKHFANDFDIGSERGKWNGIGDDNGNNEILENLRAGPENEYYWDDWHYVLNNAEYTDNEGNVYRLFQEGTVFAICEELMTDREYLDFFGEPRE